MGRSHVRNQRPENENVCDFAAGGRGRGKERKKERKKKKKRERERERGDKLGRYLSYSLSPESSARRLVAFSCRPLQTPSVVGVARLLVF